MLKTEEKRSSSNSPVDVYDSESEPCFAWSKIRSAPELSSNIKGPAYSMHVPDIQAEKWVRNPAPPCCVGETSMDNQDGHNCPEQVKTNFSHPYKSDSLCSVRFSANCSSYSRIPGPNDPIVVPIEERDMALECCILLSRCETGSWSSSSCVNRCYHDAVGVKSRS